MERRFVSCPEVMDSGKRGPGRERMHEEHEVTAGEILTEVFMERVDAQERLDLAEVETDDEQSGESGDDSSDAGDA